jgi:16S rRNA processing protein RimM
VELVVARIGRPQGLRGEVSVEVRTDDPASRFVVGAQLRTDPADAGPLTISSVRDQSGRTILSFTSVSDRTGAEGLRGLLLVVDVDVDAATQDEDEWYDHQLIGLSAVDTAGAELGVVARLEHLPAQDLLVVRATTGEVLVPFVSALVPVVDVAGGRVVIDPPGGLFDDAPDDITDDASDDITDDIAGHADTAASES